jgi:hypothetical protein
MAELALLAQLVEHLHGKEGVNGSSPLEGSAKAPHSGVFGVMHDVALEVPLAALAVGWRRQGDDSRRTRVQVFRHPLDREWVRLNGEHLLIVFEGRDAAGKGGARS